VVHVSRRCVFAARRWPSPDTNPHQYTAYFPDRDLGGARTWCYTMVQGMATRFYGGSMDQSVASLLAELLHQEQALQFDRFDNVDAYQLGQLCADTARAEGLGVTIDICRNGQQLFHAALAGTSADNDEWVKRKNRVVNRFGHSSFYMGAYYKSRSTTIQDSALLDPTQYAAHGGAFPIIVKHVGVVGTVTVSGLPQADDHAFVVRMLTKFINS
jgi:uncharacterized protein (UPF0303 family)